MAASPEPNLEEQLWTHRRDAPPIRAVDVAAGAAQPAARSALEPGARGHQRLGRRVPGHTGSCEPGGTVAASAAISSAETNAAGRDLVERLALVPAYAAAPERWTDAAMTPRVRRLSDSLGYARPDRWYAGAAAICRPQRSGRGTVLRTTNSRRRSSPAYAARSSMRRARPRIGGDRRRTALCRARPRSRCADRRGRPAACGVPSAMRSRT